MIKKNRWIQGISICMALVLSVSSLTGCKDSGSTNSSVEQESEETAAPHDFNEDEDSNLGAWTRAMGSVLISMNEGNPYYFGGYESNQANREAAVNILQQTWSITNKEELLTQIQSLVDTGARKEFVKEARRMSKMSKKKFNRAMKQLSGDLLVHYELMEYNWEEWGGKSLLAWDMCRVSHLSQWGYIAGYLNRQEAQAVVEPAAAMLQKHFENWEQIQTNWLDGYAYHVNIDMEQADNEYLQRKGVYQELVENQPKEIPLYDESLFSETIIPIQGVSYEELMSELNEKQDKKKSDKKKKSASKKSEATASKQTKDSEE